jgi:hypothetical protein
MLPTCYTTLHDVHWYALIDSVYILSSCVIARLCTYFCGTVRDSSMCTNANSEDLSDVL